MNRDCAKTSEAVVAAAPVIAIDGPAASGKGTISQGVAAALGYRYLDSGSLYRLVALERERSEQERERDRAERERRRAVGQPHAAGAAARQPPAVGPAEPGAAVPAGGEPDTPAPAAGEPPAPGPAAAEPEVVGAAAVEPAAVGPAAGEPDVAVPEAGELGEAGVEHPVERLPTEEFPAVELPAEEDRPPPAPRPTLLPDFQRPTDQRNRGRLRRARAGALLGLAVAIAAVSLLIDSLGGTKHASTAGVASVVNVVIPEGETGQQIARIAAADGLTGSYLAASRRSRLLNPRRYGAPSNTPDLEGFLFPASYEINASASVSRLVAEQLVAFRRRFGPNEIRRAQALHVTPYQLLTVASMVEREAKTARDRPLIAAVIYNRLKQGIALGIDATIYYALAKRKGIAAYAHELTAADLQIASPYNTRANRGLPPTPISNPGMASIEAAARPARVPYLYYVVAADGCGEHVFSTTYARFERDAAAYQAAVKRNGGHPPTCKAK